MALIVEDGTGLANAESYISVASATEYLQQRGKGDSWDTVEDQEVALRKATDYMQQAYGLRWLGTRASSAQALDWPRSQVADPYYPPAFIPNNLIPNAVKRACAELALLTVDGELLKNLEPIQSSVKVGPIEISYDPNSKPYTEYRLIDMILRGYIGSSGAMAKLERT